jgi:broad specificity phosphatase PhoE
MPLILLVRHAQASFGTENYDRLSDLGRQQSRWLGEYFAARGLSFRSIYAGTLVRQQDTARELLATMGHDASGLVTHAGLNEYSGEALYAAYTGGADPVVQQRADFKGYWRTFRAAMQAWADDGLENMPESWEQFGARMRSALAAAASGLERNDVALVVSSGGAIGRLLGEITGAPSSTAIEFNLQFRNTGFCELVSVGDSLRVASFNNVPHLEFPDRRHAITYA